MLIDRAKLDKMKVCFHLLPDPGPEVCLELYDHIKGLECVIARHVDALVKIERLAEERHDDSYQSIAYEALTSKNGSV